MPTFDTAETVSHKIPLVLSLSKYLRINLVLLTESILPSLRPDQLRDLREKIDRLISKAAAHRFKYSNQP